MREVFYDEFWAWERIVIDNVGRFVAALLAFLTLKLLGVF